ncbi:MAG: GPR endopeptidase, partial [Clostridia bacterium]|nr:GPR endopeptidase [Clostridia bacterium]
MSKALRDFSPQTDLACERMRADTDLPGVEYREEEGKGCRISRLSVTSREGAESIGKPEGTYVTMSFPPLFELQDGEIATLSSTLSSLVLEFLARLAPTARSVLAVGLGN